ncbi:molecular chaperone [Pseudaeromonas paramecii]|uniref:Molecular chaperone n=1 Tax=Pseudaeromonas paramecii TaxID=2138166 RepID=A0ABP8QCJ0_9GAMM
MHIGFDYGTSNCAVALMDQGRVRRLPLEGGDSYLPSTLFAPHREAIADLLHGLLPASQQATFAQARQLAIAKGRRLRPQLDDEGLEYELLVGRAATARYLEAPEEGYYLKSPKSFLGATGLSASQLDLFCDLVSAMMATIKTRAETALGAEIRQAVIGQPVNFQGLGGEESNRQAREILQRAARLAGFAEVSFQFEPVAAGLEYEASLSSEQRVLVLDIGGGTTDCSLLRMGPDRAGLTDRSADLLGHTGERIGGNDFDIRLAVNGLMGLCGMASQNQRGLPMPAPLYWDAMSINDVQALGRFHAPETGRLLQQLRREAREPALLDRLIRVREEKLSHQLVWQSEQAKIGLAQAEQVQQLIALERPPLAVEFSRHQLAQVSQPLLEKIGLLADEAMKQAGCRPDALFVTGGSAHSPVIRAWLQQRYPDLPLVEGDHFGSVIAGLARWAERCYG